MSLGILIAFIFAYSAALWLGLYLLSRDPRSPRLALTGLGLIAYALAVATDLLGNATPGGPANAVWPLLLLPALFWTGTLTSLLPDEVRLRYLAGRVWGPVALGLMTLLFLFTGFGIGRANPTGRGISSSGVLQVLIGAAVILPMLAVGYLVWRNLKQYRTGSVRGVLMVFTLFLALSTVLILLPLGWLPRSWLLLGASVDVVVLGLVIARFDALDQGEALMPDMIRSFDAALISALVFGGQVVLVIALSTGPTASMLALLLAMVTTAIAASTLSDRISAILDRLALGRLPLLRRARSDLRTTARSLQRRDELLDPTKLDEAEFARLTRRALSNFGDLPRLSASPLINLNLVEKRLSARNATDDVLERAAELKSILSESIDQLKPRTGADFGTSDEWRYYNALYFPYVMGVKPYSNRTRVKEKDPAAGEAREWLRDVVPERTLYNWQNSAAKLVARDLRSRNAS